MRSLRTSMREVSEWSKKIWNHKQGRTGLIFVGFLIIIAIAAPIITPYGPYDYDIKNGLLGPSIQHPLGTDKNGVDILTQIIYGTRVSLLIGIITGVSVTMLGAILGVIAGYFGRFVQGVILNIINVLMVIPILPLMIVLNNISSSYVMMIFIFVAFGWSGTARIVRAQVLSIKESNYVKCAELYGASKWYIMRRHILPNVAHLLIMNCALSCAGFMIAEAGLSFLGLGDPSAISWGKLLVKAEESAFTAKLWAWVVAPGAAIFFSVTGFMKIGYALEDILNPRMKEKQKMLEEKPPTMTIEDEMVFSSENLVDNSILAVDNLKVMFQTPAGMIKAVENVSITIGDGESVALVGESGCGKSVTGLSIMKLLATPPAIYSADRIQLTTREDQQLSIHSMSDDEMESIRGKEIAMIYQDPSSALNPVMTIGAQIEEVLLYHTSLNKKQRKQRAIQLLTEVGITDTKRRYEQYPHEFSGGMKQRILIAMAMGCNPRLLIADEPTTALDVSIQAQILSLIKKLRREHRMSMLLITHDLGVVKNSTDRVYIMYCGKIVEEGRTADVLSRPFHPYTKGLIATVPSIDETIDRFVQIPKNVPHPSQKPSGCYFSDRCNRCSQVCRDRMPPLVEVAPGRKVRCFHRENEL